MKSYNLFQSESVIKNMPSSIQKQIKLLSFAYKTLFLIAKYEEYLSAKFAFDVRLFNRNELFFKKIAEKQKKYELEFLTYIEQVFELEVSFEDINQESIQKLNTIIRNAIYRKL